MVRRALPATTTYARTGARGKYPLRTRTTAAPVTLHSRDSKSIPIGLPIHHSFLYSPTTVLPPHVARQTRTVFLCRFPRVSSHQTPQVNYFHLTYRSGGDVFRRGSGLARMVFPLSFSPDRLRNNDVVVTDIFCYRLCTFRLYVFFAAATSVAIIAIIKYVYSAARSLFRKS